ncbi:MAG: ABC transporter substrate-binding protein [Nannocystaceae bacterium]
MLGDKLVNRYQVLAEVGQGGMGVVYRARDLVLGREVAIKVIASAGNVSDQTEQRFRGEAQTIAQLDHPSIVSIYDFGRHRGSFFYVMPMLEGVSLAELIRKRALSVGEILEIGAAVADALAYTHARDIVHRDIKPENVMVSRDGGVLRVTVMDFGLAKSANDEPLTKTGILIGTVTYLSPEQVAGRVADALSDIYSLGTVLYECLAGEAPFVGETQAVLYRIVHEYPRRLEERGISVDDDLEAVIMSCLHKVPGDRPASMKAIARTLRQLRLRHETGDLGEVTKISAPLKTSGASPFVGRQAELGELQQRLNRTIAGEGQFVVVGGDVGVGKSRLLGELEALARARGIAVLHGNLAEQVGAFPYFGFCEVMVDFFKNRKSTSEGMPLPELGDLAPDLIALFPTLGEIEALRDAAGGAPRSADAGGRAHDNRIQLFETLARALVRLAATGPIVLVFEDLHAADASIEALNYVVRRLAATPAMIVATYRTTEVDRAHPLTRLIDELRGSKRFALLQLRPLAKTEHRRLLAALFGETPISDAIAERFFEATEGNPFFTKEVVRALLRDEKETADALVMLGPSHLSSALPGTIQQAIDRRVSRLPEALREVLAVAAVLGRSFDARDLERLVRDVDDLDEALDQLIEEGLLEEERQSRGDRLSFVSGVVREVLYAQIPRRRRRNLHRTYAKKLEGRYGGRLERVYAQLLHHYAEGDVPERSVFYGIRAARHSLDSFSADEAIRAGRTALEFLDEEWEGEAAAVGEVHELLARAYAMSGDLDSALRESEAAIACYGRLELAEAEVRALLFAARTAWQARRTDDTRRWVDLGIGAARAAAQPEALGQLLALAGTLAGLRGDNDLAAEYMREAEELERKPAGEGARPTFGGRVVVALASPSVACEPAALQTQEDAEVLANVFETLLVTDEEGHLHPGLAERWEPGLDDRVFRFSLRAGVRFHDGHALAAADVIASLERLIRLRAGALPPAVADVAGVEAFLAGTAERVAGLAVVAPLVVEITLKTALPIYPVLLATPAAAITRISAEAASDGHLAAGTGPFRLASLGVRSTVIERWDGYWRQPAALLDAIEFRFVETARAMAQGLRTRELDIIRVLSAEDLDDEVGGPGSLGASVEGPVKMTYFALFNARSGPLCRRRDVRLALAQVVPVQELVWQELGRFGVPAAGLIPSGILGYDPGRRRPRLSVDEGRDLLISAGVTAKATLRVLVFPVIVERYGSFFDAVCERWAALGLDIEVLRLDMGTFIATGVIPENVDVVVLRWGADYDDPDDFTHGHFHTASGRWREVFSSPEADVLLERGRSEGEPAIRERCYRELENLFEREGALLPLFHAVDSRVAGADVHGMRLRGSQPFVNYAEISRDAGRRRRSEPKAAALRVPMRGLVSVLDPIRGGYAECHEALSTVFESLTRRVGGAQIVPWLAESIEAIDGGLAYRIRLRRDITFHDGRRLTARDVRYTFERMLRRADATSRWLYAPIVGAHEMLTGEAAELTGLHVRSDHELTIELVRPLVYFPGMLSHSVCAIIPEGADQRGDRWAEGPIGTGPFRVVHFDPGRRLELERAPSYWRPGLPRCRSLVFHFGAAPAEIRSGFEAGRFSIAGEMVPEDVEALRRDPVYASGYRENPSFATYFIACNVHRGPLADRALRRQIAEAIDRPRLARQTLGRLVKPAQGLIPPGLLGYEAETGAAVAPVDTPQAGLRDIELTCLVHSVFLSEYRAYFRRLCETLAVLGIRLKVLEGYHNLYDLPEPEKKLDVTITRWFGDFPDAHTFCGTLHTREGVFGPLVGSERFDKLLEKGQVTADPQARHAIYRQIDELIAEEACIIPLFHPQTYRFARPEVEGLQVSHDGPVVAYEDLALRGDEG